MASNEAFKKEKDFEETFIKCLQEHGWGEVIKNPSEDDLYRNWANIIYLNNRKADRLGNCPLSDNEIKQLKNYVGNKNSFELNSDLINGQIPLKRDDDSPDKDHRGKTVYLDIFDRDKTTDGSRYQIAEQVRFKGQSDAEGDIRTDVTLLINGIPVIHIELKKSTELLNNAEFQIVKYSKRQYFTGLYSFIQIFVAMTPGKITYFANLGTDEEFNPDYYFQWADVENNPVEDWREFTSQFLNTINAHDFVGYYTVADRRDDKLKVLRSYQYNAVKAIENVVDHYDWADPNRDHRGGYIWQTTGSGKTLTSFKAANVISKKHKTDKVIFLVDRTELDTQSYSHFQCFADSEDEVQNTKTTNELVGKLKSDDSDERVIVTSIQKASIIGRNREKVNREADIKKINEKRIVIIIDECHRDTFGDMMDSIKNTFTSALFFGFTGTPIIDEKPKKGCTSEDVFGNELKTARYPIADGIRDGNVLGFHASRVPIYEDEDLKEAVARSLSAGRKDSEKYYYKLMNELRMAGYIDEKTGKRIKGVEDYLPKGQYSTKDYREKVVLSIKQNFATASNGNKFHAIFATTNIHEAVKYYFLFKKLAPEIHTTLLVDKNDDNTPKSYEKIEHLKEIINDYNEMYKDDIGKPYTLKTYANMKKDISNRLSHDNQYKNINEESKNRLDLLIVVNQMLTGFDSKYVNTLYIDKMLENENIIQAFSRTNRILDADKPNGLIYYFRKPNTLEKNIDEAVKNYSGDRPYGIFVDSLEKNLLKFNDTYKEIKDLFEENGIENFSALPESGAAKAKFSHLYNVFYSLFETIRVQGFSWDKKVYGTDRNIKVEIEKDTFEILSQRYTDLVQEREKTDENEDENDAAFDIDPRIARPEKGKYYDYQYIDEHFKRYIELTLNNDSKEKIDEAYRILCKDFAKFSEEQQKYAQMLIEDIKNGTYKVSKEDNIVDIINEYMANTKESKRNAFADLFGLDKDLLEEILNVENIDEYDMFNRLKNTADPEKIKDFFKERGENISVFAMNMEFDKMLRKCIKNKNFEEY